MVNRLMPGCDLQWNVLPVHQSESYVRQIIDKGRDDGTLSGLILIACPRTVQEIALELNVPAVVFGGVYATTSALPSIDHDEFEVGFQLAQHLVKAGHKKFGVIMRENRLPGDDRFMGGIHQALAEGELAFGAIVERSLPVDARAARDEVRKLFEADDRPTAMVCRDAFYADVVVSVAEETGLVLGRDIDVVHDGVDNAELRSAPLACMRSQLDLDIEAERVVELLNNVLEGTQDASECRTIPVALVPG